MIEFESVKTRISAPAHPSATGGRVSGLVSITHSFSIVVSVSFPCRLVEEEQEEEEEEEEEEEA